LVSTKDGASKAVSRAKKFARLSINFPALLAMQTRPWRQWYQLERWRRRRRLQLRHFPVCRMCEARGLVTVATIADHVSSHRGDWNAFLLGELQSLCADCHNRLKQRLTLDGFCATSLDRNGWPLDLRHPANQ